jgi:hypothetical protein
MRCAVLVLLGCFIPSSSLRRRSDYAVNTSTLASQSLTGTETERMASASALTLNTEEAPLLILELSLDMYKNAVTSQEPISVGDMFGLAKDVGLGLLTATNPALGLVVGFFDGLIFGEPEESRNPDDFDKIVQAVLAKAEIMIDAKWYSEKKTSVNGMMAGITSILNGAVPSDEFTQLTAASNAMSLLTHTFYGDCPHSSNCKKWQTNLDGFDNLLFELAFADLDIMVRLELLAHYTGDEYTTKKEHLQTQFAKHSELLTAHYDAFLEYIKSDELYKMPTRAPLKVCKSPTSSIWDHKCGTYKVGKNLYTNRTFVGSKYGICKEEGQEFTCQICETSSCRSKKTSCDYLYDEWGAEVRQCTNGVKNKFEKELIETVGASIQKFKNMAELTA